MSSWVTRATRSARPPGRPAPSSPQPPGPRRLPSAAVYLGDVAFRLKRKEGVSEGIRRIAAGRAEKRARRPARGRRRAGRGGPRGAQRPEEAASNAAAEAATSWAASCSGPRTSAIATPAGCFRAAATPRCGCRRPRALGSAAAARSCPPAPTGSGSRALEREREEVAGGGRRSGAGAGRSSNRGGAGRDREVALAWEAHSWSAIGPGLRRSYRKGRRGAAADDRRTRAPRTSTTGANGPRTSPTSCGSCASAWPSCSARPPERSHLLTDCLGDHHDLQLLAEDFEQREIDGKEIEKLIRGLAGRTARRGA